MTTQAAPVRGRHWTLTAVVRSPLTYPISVFWVAASAVCIGVAKNAVTWPQAVLILLGVAILLLGCSIWHEVRLLRGALDQAGIKVGHHRSTRRRGKP